MERKYLLRVSNYEYFLTLFTKTHPSYKSSHEVLAELEKKVCFKEDIDKVVLVPYKDEGDCIFDFDRIMNDGVHKYIVYDFATTIS